MEELPKLSRRESEVMEIIYALGRATVRDVTERLEDPPKSSALRSTLTILETKGHLRHEKKGREFVYLPVVGKERAARAAFRQVLRTFYDGSIGKALASHFVDQKTAISEDEVDELKTSGAIN